MKWSKISKYIFFWRRRNIEYKKAKAVTVYLQRNYGKAYKKNNGKQNKFKQKVTNDHSLDQLIEMSNRLKANRKIESDTRSLISIPFTILLSVCTVTVTISNAIIDSITTDTSVVMISPNLYSVLVYAICSCFILIFVLYQLIEFTTRRRSAKFNLIEVLVDECIEKKKKHSKELAALNGKEYEFLKLNNYSNIKIHEVCETSKKIIIITK
ncbi:hypothetical protein [Bacillus atrophaeus]|uniref:hypothetical protein n=1 Tax=Bacillus atrophaeus TaxID=1452 RepID=UPI000C05BCDC|nr:hypothetical protein [Bacillus atrophaeus]ATO27812.1 hypothetical protein RA13_07015 [Bacillus atrophaeus]